VEVVWLDIPKISLLPSGAKQNYVTKGYFQLVYFNISMLFIYVLMCLFVLDICLLLDGQR